MARPSEIGWSVWANQVAGGALPGRAGGARREAGGLWSAGRTGEGRESREGREREKEFEFKFKIFSKIPFEYESCREFKNLQLLF